MLFITLNALNSCLCYSIAHKFDMKSKKRVRNNRANRLIFGLRLVSAILLLNRQQEKEYKMLFLKNELV
jgi:hypothetical protein